MKPVLQKSLRHRGAAEEKLLDRLFYKGLTGIKVRTKWQSGTVRDF